MQTLEQTFLAQYANSPILTGILRRFNQAADPYALIEIFLKNVLDIKTATGWGLDVWGRIVGVERVLKVPVSDEFFGFEEALGESGATGLSGFNQAPFYLGGAAALTENYALTDAAFRKLILCKAAANITNGAIKDLNRALMILFGDEKKKIWIKEGISQIGDVLTFEEAEPQAPAFGHAVFSAPAFRMALNMNITLCYNWPPSTSELTLLSCASQFLRPSGIKTSLAYVPQSQPPDTSLPRQTLWSPQTGCLTLPNGTFLTLAPTSFPSEP